MSPEVLVATVMRREGGSGVQTHVRTLVEHLEAAGSPVRVVSPFEAGSPLVRPVFAVRLALQPVSGAAGVWWYRHWHTAFLRAALGPALAAAREAAAVPPVVYAQCPGSALAALEVRDRLGATSGGPSPVVMAAHFNVSEADEWAGKGEIRPGGRLFRAIRDLEARVLPRLDGLVFVSEAARRDCLARVPAAAAVPSVVVPNAVPAGAPSPSAGPLRDLVTVGSLEPRKNQGYLLEVVAEARRRGRPCTLTVVGDGPQRRELERRAVALGVEDDVELVGHRSDVPAWLGRHRVYCHTALTESFGIVLAEAMRAGLPVLAGAVGGIPEVVRDGVEGRHWPLDDVAAAADLLLGLLDDDDARRRMGRAGSQRAADVLGADVVCPRLLGFLASLSARGAPAPAGGGPR
ncbi:MAG: glycosyltransferase family 4 protein [Nocardioides marinisabuli]|uniref:glycosyltransferase family 4 protein n=1 Tax=Nocardioides marinisabuli TaxID=419476 RepID=UPI00321958BD